MQDEQANTIEVPNRRYLRLGFVLALTLCSGAIYLGYETIDWTQKPVTPPPASSVVQPPELASAAPSFDAVSADESGLLVAAGRAQPGATVLLRNGEQTLGEAKADEHGEWVLLLQQPLAPGGYTLSLLAVDPKTQASVPGKHSAALTVAPHGKSESKPAVQMAAASQLNASVPAANGTQAEPRPVKVASVKRGDTLWAIAHRFYGKGMRYGEIAGANKEQIRNPNLIYPKQQLVVPH